MQAVVATTVPARSAKLPPMPVICPSRFGVVLRRNDRTKTSIARLARWRTQSAFMSEDEHLVAFSVASNATELQDESKALRDEGCRPGIDFVLTSQEDGVIGPLPDWLAAEDTAEPIIAVGDSRFPSQVHRQVLAFVGR